MNIQAKARLTAAPQEDLGAKRVAAYERLKKFPFVIFNPVSYHQRVGGLHTVGNVGWKSSGHTEAGFAFAIASASDTHEFGINTFRFNDDGMNGNGNIFKIDVRGRKVWFLDQQAYLEGEVKWGDSAPITRLAILDDTLLDHLVV